MKQTRTQTRCADTNSFSLMQALKTRVHVNMWDLIDSRRVGTDVKLFKTHTALAAYTLKTRKFFPLYIAKGNEISKSLLRPIR